ncbi:MAG: hypothetical protein JKX98_03225 [Alcanivoracaceae bacterium]|nr:hypothetical protein [Alcanivoracaceae bacterium]
MKELQTFSNEYLQRCKDLSIEEKLDFIENFRLLHAEIKSTSKLISLKLPAPYLQLLK